MRLYECDRCKAVNRVSAIRLDKQPICGACGQELDDFPFCRPVRRAWRHKGLIAIFAWAAAVLTIIVVGRQSSGGQENGAPAVTQQPPPKFAYVPPTLYPAQSAPPPPTAVPQPDGILRGDKRPGVAPFSIMTPTGGGGFFVKLLVHGTKQSRVVLFVNSGSRFETKVPLGEYDIVYATGERWLGCADNCRKPIFWQRRPLYKLNSSFLFSANSTDTGIEYIGHDIELIDQKNGNLSKTAISEDEFGE